VETALELSPDDGPDRATRAYEQVAARLRQRITSGELREGDRLPSETALAVQTGVSRSTVREALRTLQEAGVVERASPRIMVVRRQTEDTAFRELQHALRRRRVTFHHLHEALLTIEPELTRLAAERADAADIRELRQNLDAQSAALEDFAAWSRLDEEFHLTIAELSGNPALVIARAPISQLLVPTVHRFIRSSSQAAHGLRYHERILAEIEAHDPDLAAAVMRRHIDDFRVAWEKAGLDFDMHIADIRPAPEGAL
jgi:GntR family transcriptional regulator, transcriptional repressor for pyruvate dehydrogenase complex